MSCVAVGESEGLLKSVGISHLPIPAGTGIDAGFEAIFCFATALDADAEGETLGYCVAVLLREDKQLLPCV